MKGEMQWRRASGGLTLYVDDGQGFRIYNQSRHAQDDFGNGHSKGWATYQACYRAGYTVIPTNAPVLPEPLAAVLSKPEPFIPTFHD